MAGQENRVGDAVGKLVLFLADGTTLDIPLDSERISIGRRTGNDICLPYPAVSGKHAVVVTMTTGSVLEDLGSTNGTFVNRKRVAKYFLHDRDSIDIGRQKLVYCTDVNAVVAAAPRRLRADGRSDDGQAAPVRVPRVVAPTPPSARGESPSAAGDTSVHTNTTVRLPVDTFSETAMAEFATSEAARAKQEAGASTGDAGDAATPQVGPTIRVLTGPNAGRMVPLNKDETLIGRVGLQVALVRKGADGFRLLQVEGADPPQVNGVPVPPEGSLLRPGDVAEVAGARLEFADPEHPAEPANLENPSA